MRFGFRELALLHQDLTQTVVDKVLSGIDPKRLLEMIRRPSQIAFLRDCHAELIMGIGKIGLDAHGPLLMNASFRQISKFGKHDSEIVLSERILRIERNGTLEVPLCRLQVGLFVKNDAKIVVELGILRIHG